MYTMVTDTNLQKLFASFYEQGKIASAVCHATSILLHTKLTNGKLLVEGRKWTGFANSEEEFADKAVGRRIQPFWIESEARKILNTTFTIGPAFAAYSVVDGNLITGQQQNSGSEVARLVMKALEGLQ
jgi:putative intracellular protease/amidase